LSRADLIVLGGGPAGYAAALRAAGLGARVLLVEREGVGGTCARRGCIPVKAMLEKARGGGDREGMVRFREEAVSRVARGVKWLLEKAGVEIFQEEGELLAPGRVRVGKEELLGRAVVVATGSSPLQPSWAPRGERVWTSDQAVEMPFLPSPLLVVGGGPVGVELAFLYRLLGLEVHLVEARERILPGEDGEVSRAVEDLLRREGVAVYTGVGVEEIRASPHAVSVRGQGFPPLEGEVLLLAVGRRPEDGGLGPLGRGWVRVDERQATLLPGVFAAGDVTGQRLLAHYAFAQGMRAAEAALGLEPLARLDVVPSCVFTWPEVASVGKSEEAAREEGVAVVIGRFPFSASGRAVTLGERRGFLKVVAEKDTGRILGVHIFGPQASEMIYAAAQAVGLGLTLAEVARIFPPHPTLSEAFFEACLAALGRPLHLPGPGH